MADHLPTTVTAVCRRRSHATTRRAPLRPLDDRTTELVRVIPFVWVAGAPSSRCSWWSANCWT